MGQSVTPSAEAGGGDKPVMHPASRGFCAPCALQDAVDVTELSIYAEDRYREWVDVSVYLWRRQERLTRESCARPLIKQPHDP
jgi:hypothetical protein